MATPLNKFQKGQTLTASSINAIVDLVNDHEKRLQSQQLRPGVGYNFSTSTGGTSLQIIPKGSNDENASTYTHPFKVAFVGKDDEENKYTFSINGGSVFGGDGSCASYQAVEKTTLDVDPYSIEGKTDDNGEYRELIITALFHATPMAVIGDWTEAPGVNPGEPSSGLILTDPAEWQSQFVAWLNYRLIESGWQTIQSIMNTVGTPLARSIPFKGEFQKYDAMSLDEWSAHVGAKTADGSTPTDIYEMDATWEVNFPIAIVRIKTTSTGDLSQGNTFAVEKITQILHGDIYWYAHWTNPINVDGTGKVS